MEKKQQLKLDIRAGELCYYLFFGILLMAKGIGWYDGQPVFKICLLAAGFFLFLKLCVTEHTVKELVCMGLLTLLGLLIYRSSGEKAALVAILTIIGMKNVPVRRVMKLGAVLFGISFFFSVFMALYGGRPGTAVIHDKLGLGHVMRWGMGYPHPNVFHISYVILAAWIVYAAGKQGAALWKLTGVLFLGNLYVFLYSLSYTGFIFTTVFLALVLYFDLRKKPSKAEKFLLQCVMPGCVLFSIFAPLVLKGKAFDLFNKILTNRLALSQHFLQNFKIQLFGTRTVVESARLTLDCSYMFLLMYYGILATILFVLLYFFMIRKMVRDWDGMGLAITLGLLIAGISEPFLFNLSFKNITFVFLGEFLMNYFFAGRKEGSFWCRTYQIIPKGDLVLSVPDNLQRKLVSSLQRVWCESGKMVILAGMIGMLASGICGSLFYQEPESIITGSVLTDYDGEDFFYLTEEEIAQKENSLILGYHGAETKLFEFSGRIMDLEHIRYAVSVGLTGGLAAGLLVIGVFTVRKNGKNKKF